MKILHLSDTHGCHRRLKGLPEADVVVHSGDFTMAGSESEALDFISWFSGLPYAHKVFICGNHDACLYEAGVDGLDTDVHYLYNSGIELDGVKFYGVPLFMEDVMTDRQSDHYAAIPEDTDVLITHAPAYGILDFDDIHFGSRELRQRLEEIKPRLHLFGHVHAQHGVTQAGVTTCSNGSIMDKAYLSMNPPNLLEL